VPEESKDWSGTSLWIAILMALGVGVLVALQPLVNAGLARYGTALIASTVSFFIGTVLLIVLVVATGLPKLKEFLSLENLSQIPPAYFAGGFIGALIVYGMTRLAPQLGSAGVIALSITGQILTSLVADHFGLFGLSVTPVTARRLLGILLLLIGAQLALR